MKPSDEARLRVLGLDPGSLRTGYGLVEEARGKLSLVEAGVFAAPQGTGLAGRLCSIYEGLERLLGRVEPQEVALESLFHAKNARSALLLGHARGVVVLACARRGFPLFEYAPREVKKALTGYGHAEKEQVQRMVQVLLGLDRGLTPHDASDGAAIAICHLHSRRHRFISGRPSQLGATGATSQTETSRLRR